MAKPMVDLLWVKMAIADHTKCSFNALYDDTIVYVFICPSYLHEWICRTTYGRESSWGARSEECYVDPFDYFKKINSIYLNWSTELVSYGG